MRNIYTSPSSGSSQQVARDDEMHDIHAGAADRTFPQVGEDLEMREIYVNPTPGTSWQASEAPRDVHTPPQHSVKGRYFL